MIETVQFLVGGGRVADAEDFLLNSLGAGAGLLVLTAARRLAALTRRERASGRSSEHARPAHRHGMLM